MNSVRPLKYPRGRILVFARTPQAGRVKTRLAQGIGDEYAARLYRQLVRMTVLRVEQAALAPLRLLVTPDLEDPLFEAFAAQGIELALQRGADLGEAMCNALQDALQDAEFALLIGSDCPALSMDYLARACHALHDGRQVVLGPAEDGGYVLVGVRQCSRHLFSEVPWGTDQVLPVTRRRLAELGWQALELDTLWDLDRPQDLLRWRRGPAIQTDPTPGAGR